MSIPLYVVIGILLVLALFFGVAMSRPTDPPRRNSISRPVPRGHTPAPRPTAAPPGPLPVAFRGHAVEVMARG